MSQVMADLDLDDTVSHAVNVAPLAYSAPRRQGHRFLELLHFSEADLQKRIGALSGGQRAQVALAQALLSGAGVVLLDEPTNPLDLPSIQVMQRTLLHFPGAVIVATHDRLSTRWRRGCCSFGRAVKSPSSVAIGRSIRRRNPRASGRATSRGRGRMHRRAR